MNILAVDIGTSRIKTACFDEKGRMNCLLSHRLDRAASPELQDPEQWFTVTAGLVKQLTSQLSSPADAVVLTGNMHALLGIDSSGNPVAPAVLWSDNSSAAESDELNARYGNMLLEKFGNSSIPVFTLPKILRMKKYSEDLYRRTETFMQSKDFISFRLTGNRVTDPTDGSGVLGMELNSNTWDKDFFDDLHIDTAKLPEIYPSASVCGYVTKEAAALTGLLQGTPVVTGTGDLASAATGSGVDPHTASLTLGTAGQLLAAGKKGDGRKLAGKLFIFAHTDPEQELYLGSVPSGGFSFEWLAKLHNITVPSFFELASNVSLTADQPFFLPYILGRGAPSMDYTPSGAWHGLTARHTLATLCRSAVFGTLCPLRQCMDLLEKISGKRDRIILQALACREQVVRETAGALFLQQKYIPENSEASLLGAAVTGAAALRCYGSIRSASEQMIGEKALSVSADPLAQKLFERFMALAGN